MKILRIVLILLAITVCLVAVGCGEPKQKETKSSSVSTTDKQEEELVMEKTGFVPDSSDGSYYRIVGKMINGSPDFSCVGATASLTLFDAQNVILGTEQTDISPLYPNSYRWIISTPISTAGQTPARAEIKVNTAGCWKKTSEKNSPYSIVQKDYIGGEYDSKITGVFRYAGEPLSKNRVVKINAVALNANGDPLGAGSQETGNITTAGDYPFEVSLSIPLPGVADTDVSVITTNMEYVK